MDSKDLKTKLAKPVPREYMSERTGAGNQTLHYVAGDYVFHTLNEIFGPENVSTHIDEVRTIVERTVSRQVNLGSKKTEKGYEPLGMKDVAYLEVQYMVRGRIEITVGDKTIVKSGIGTGKGSGWAAEDKLVAQIHEVAIKGAETDMIKRAAKKLGPIFGLSIGTDGKQLYASVAEDEAQQVEDATEQGKGGETGKTDTAKPETAKPEAAKPEPAKPEAAKPATTTTAAPKAADPKPAQSAQTAGQTAAAAPAQPAAPAPAAAPTAPAAPVTAAAPAPDAGAPTAGGAASPASVRLNPVNAPAAPTPAAPATAAPAAAGKIELPRIDVEALKALDSQGWVTKMKQLKAVLETCKTAADVTAIAHQTGHYERLINENKRVDEGFKTQVHTLMVNYITQHMNQHGIPIDIEAAIASTRDQAGTEGGDFDVPF